MNRKGFTLIEVIMVIVIMALLVLILVPNIFVLVNKNNDSSCNSLIDNIESAAKIYVTNNKYDLGFNCDVSKEITFQTLIDSGDLTGNIINPITEEQVSLDNTVSVTYNCSNNTFTYVVNGIDCVND